MNVAAIIVGIDGWGKYTLPLVESIRKHEPDCHIVVVDNHSDPEYPSPPFDNMLMTHTQRLCYSAAINHAYRHVAWADWTIVLSNDVLCTGPFAHMLGQYENAVAGPQLWHEHGLSWIVGWCVVIPRKVWEAVGGWDSAYVGSSVEDVDLSHSARKAGFELMEDTRLPFVHLDQKQRFNIIPDYWQTESANWRHFRAKHGV